LTSSRDTIQQLKRQLDESDSERRLLEQQSTGYKLKIDELRRQFDDTATERDRSGKIIIVFLSCENHFSTVKLKVTHLLHKYK